MSKRRVWESNTKESQVIVRAQESQIGRWKSAAAHAGAPSMSEWIRVMLDECADKELK